MPLTRRTLVTTASAALLAPRLARAATATDDTGRTLVVRAPVRRVLPAGLPAAILLYTLAPELLLGWPRANRPEECEFMLPEICARPEVGRLTGRGNTPNLETVIALQPDLIVDVGSTSDLFVTQANRPQGRRRRLCRLLQHDARRHHQPHCLRAGGKTPAGVLRARPARPRHRTWRLDQCRDHRASGAQRRRRAQRRAGQCPGRTSAAVEPGRHRHRRSGFRG